jgi:hypothetical protein
VPLGREPDNGFRRIALPFMKHIEISRLPERMREAVIQVLKGCKDMLDIYAIRNGHVPTYWQSTPTGL